MNYIYSIILNLMFIVPAWGMEQHGQWMLCDQPNESDIQQYVKRTTKVWRKNLILAIKNKAFDRTTKLLNNPLKTHHKEELQYSFWFASWHHNEEATSINMMDIFLKTNEIDINYQGTFYETVLISAVLYGRRQMVEYFLKQPTIDIHVKDTVTGLTALQYTEIIPNREDIQNLLKNHIITKGDICIS